MRESTLWMLNIIAGAFILVLLGVHMTIMHLDAVLGFFGYQAGDAVGAQAVFERSRQGLFMITYIVLLGTALYHGFYGLRKIVFELSLTSGAEKAVDWILSISGLALFVYGGYVAIALFAA